MTFGTRRDRLVVEAGIAVVSIPAYYFAHMLTGLQMRNGQGLPGAGFLMALAILVGFLAGFVFLAELVLEKRQDHY